LDCKTKSLFTEPQIQAISPKPEAFAAGKKLSAASQWLSFGKSDRAMWGEIKGSGSTPYRTQIDIQDVAYKCSCPSRQFPCKHGLGLLLLYSDATKVTDGIATEPDWVIEWVDKRRTKAEAPPKEEKEYTNEEREKLDKAKEKRQDDRIVLVNAGIQELDLWLQDIVRLGLLELQNKSSADISNMAARMVDSKAPGLASWVNSLNNIDYGNTDKFHEEATSIIGKLYLLVLSWKNFENLTPEWQQTIKTLFGWTQSSKELLADANASSLKDEWIVLGQEVEEIDDITIQRNWLWAVNNNKTALILNFGTRFSPLENTVIPGLIIEAELLFFPSVLEHRAVMKIQKSILPLLNTQPKFCANWNEVNELMTDQQAINPWSNNQAFLLEKVSLTKVNDDWFLIDKDNCMMMASQKVNEEIFLKWILISGNIPCNISVVMKGSTALPLGIFFDKKYMLL
jgi:hypothetical protein